MSALKLAVIGAGLIGQKHLELVAANAECKLAAICDVHSSAFALAEHYGARYYQHFTTMLAEESLDGVIIAAPTQLHAEVGVACAQRGVHMLMEKPIAATLKDAQLLLNTTEACGVQVLVGHHRRHNPLVQQTRAVIQSGTLGKLVGVSALFTLLKPADYFQVSWRAQPGGGPVLINLIHDIDNLRFICGEIESVFSMTSSAVRHLGVEDTASVTLRFTNGALGSILLSDTAAAPWSYELTSRENPAYPPTDQDCYYFCGTEGALAFPQMKLWRYAHAAQGWYQPLEQQHLAVQAMDPLAAQLGHFCQVIRGEQEPLVSGREGLKTLAATQAIWESAHRQLPVHPADLLK